MMIAFRAVVIFLIIWAVRSTATPGQQDENTALRILDERLARGEERSGNALCHHQIETAR